jgi:hypothetical protein
VSGPSLVKQARRQSAQYRGSPLTEHRETSSILGACANKIVAMETELATLRDDNARLREAIALAVGMLAQDEPGDSRAVSNEFVALAAVECGIANDDDWAVIRAALAPQEPGR